MEKTPQFLWVGEAPTVSNKEKSNVLEEKRARLCTVLNQIEEYWDDWHKLSHIFGDKEKENLDELEHKQQRNEKIREKIDEWDIDSVREMVQESSIYKLDSETADKLCESWHSEMVRDNVRKFESFSNFTYDKLREKYDIYSILYTENIIDKFEDHNYIVNDLITSGDIGRYHANIEFKWLNNETLKSLLKQGFYFFDMRINEDTFTWLDKEAFKMLLDSPGSSVYDKSYGFWCMMKKSFTWLDRESFKYLLKYCYNLEFYQYKAKDFLLDAIEKNIGIFSWLNKTDAKTLIKRWLGSAVVNNLKVFKWLDKEIAELLVECWFWWDIVDKLEEFWFKKED